MGRTAVTALIFAYAGYAFGFAFPLEAATVGSGSPNQLVQQSFIVAYNRGPFGNLVGSPTKDVRAFGNPGLIQEFPAKTGSTTFALIKPDPTVPAGGLDTLQVYGDMYAYYNSIGVAVAGYPINDTGFCATCQYQLFTKNYALFVYPGSLASFTVKDPFFSEWMNLGAMAKMGAATSAESAVTSLTGLQATQQLFASGTIFTYTVGTAATTIGIAEPLNSVFSAAGGYAQLGLPTSEALTVSASGLIRQTFEKGRIELPPAVRPLLCFPSTCWALWGRTRG